MKFLIAIIIATICLASCHDDMEFIDSVTPKNGATPHSKYAITQEQALATLNEFIEDMHFTETRSGTLRKVSTIYPIKFKAPTTLSRSNPENFDCDNLLFIVNFENEDGYAILAGDSRIDEPIIAIIDQGILSEADINSAVELIESERTYVQEFPMTGPGFFTLPETGDELYMNPNTVCLYVDSIQDTLVGNFDFSNYTILNTNNEPVLQNETPEILPTSICINYAMNKILNFNPTIPSDTISEITPPGEIYDEPYEVITKGDWMVNHNIAPILHQYKYWHQWTPFNNLFPTRREYLIVGDKRIAPAGCFPLAIAKIMTHFETPAIYTHDNYTIDWTELKRTQWSWMNTGSLSAAHLLKKISVGCGSIAFYQGTFTLPNLARQYMKKIGLNNATSHSYNTESVITMLNNGCPIIAFSMPQWNLLISHAWNIDGLKIKERTITTKTYIGTILKNIKTDTEIIEMVHCDFGWAGKSNGYYVSGIFKLNDSNAEIDPGSENDKSTYYDKYLHIITYDKPL